MTSVVESLRAQPLVGCTDVLVTWNRPSTSTSSHIYRLYRRRKASDNDTTPAEHKGLDASSPWTKVAEAKDMTEARACKLQPYTIYEFCVQTVSLVSGDGPTSGSIAVRTHPATPGDGPQNLHVKSRTTDTITVAWDPPTKPHGPLTSYHLFYDDPLRADYVEVSLPGNATTYTARHLFPGRTYRFQTFASTSAGEGPHTPILVTETMPSLTDRVAATKTAAKQRQSVVAANAPASESISGREQVQPEMQFTEEAKPSTITRGGFTAVVPAGPRASTKEQEPEATESSQQRQQQQQQSLTSGLQSVSLGEAPTEATESQERHGEGREGSTASASRFSGPARKPTFTLMAPRPTQSKPGVLQRWQHETAADQPASTTTSQRPTRMEVVTGHQVSKGAFVQQDVGTPMEADEVLRSIRSTTGTIRGKRHGVRAKLEVLTHHGEAFQDDELSRLYEAERDGSIVVYISSVMAVRDTYQRCENLKKLLYNLRLKVTYKDISLDAGYAAELKKRCGPASSVPQLFVNGMHFGNYKRVMELNEAGELRPVLQGFEQEEAVKECASCGGHGFINCTWCQGSKRSIAHPFDDNELQNRALRCTVCNEIGLVRCPQC